MLSTLPGGGKVTPPGCAAAASAPSAHSGLPGFCTRSSPGGGVGAGERRSPGHRHVLGFFLHFLHCCLLENSAAPFGGVLAAGSVWRPERGATQGSGPPAKHAALSSANGLIKAKREGVAAPTAPKLMCQSAAE